MILETRHDVWPDEAACAASGVALAACDGLGEAFIELHGPLGAGKTTFVRHLLRALGVLGRVKSPTYAVLESYEVAQGGQPSGGSRAPAPRDPDRPQVHHFDFYRFNDPQEWEDAGFRDVFAGPGLKLAEWPEKAAGLLPTADLQVFIEPVDGGRDSDDLDRAREAEGDDGHDHDDHGAPRLVRFVAHTALGLDILHRLPPKAPLA